MPMNPLKRVAFLAHASSPGFRRKLARSQEVCEQFLAVCKQPSASISFGKDSVVQADLLRTLQPDLPFIHGDRGDGGDTQEILDLKEQLMREWKLNVVTAPTRYSALYCYQHGLPIRKYLIEAIEQAEAELGVDGNAVGITRDESRARRMSVAVHGLLFDLADGRKRCYPIGHWHAIDVWAYTISRNLPYLPIYDRLAELGTDYLSPQSRTSNIIGMSAAQWGRLQLHAEASDEVRQFFLANEIEF